MLSKFARGITVEVLTKIELNKFNININRTFGLSVHRHIVWTLITF